MWTTEVSVESQAAADQIWALYEDVARWGEWDQELESSSIQGAFITGARGKLKPRGAPSSAFVLTHVEPNRVFRDRTRLPLAVMEFEHMLSPIGPGTCITHRVKLTGLLAPLFARVIGRKIAAGLPRAVQKLAQLAENGQ